MRKKKVGRPRLKNPKCCEIKTHVEAKAMAKIDACCEEMGLSRSEFARRALMDEVEKIEKSKKGPSGNGQA